MYSQNAHTAALLLAASSETVSYGRSRRRATGRPGPGRALHPPPGRALRQRDAPALPRAGAGLGRARPASRRGRHGRRRLLDAVPSVRCLVSTAAGVDHIDLAECAHRGVAVANSGTVYSADVADHAVGMLVDVLRRVSAAERFVRRRLWLLQDGGYPLASKVPSNLLFFIPVSELIS